MAFIKRKYRKPILIMTVTLLIFLLLTAIIPFLLFQFTSSQLKAKATHVQIIGHRGAAGLAPENTLASFKKAVEIGVDMVELDVHLSKDGAVVVMHDNKVDRTTNGKGAIIDLELSYIQSLDAGQWFADEFKGEKVPTLAECLQLIAGRTKVLIELKWPSKGIYEKLVEQVLETVKAAGAEDWVILQSFENKYLAQIRESKTDIIYHQLLFGKSMLLPLYFDRSIGAGYFEPDDSARSVNLYYIYAGTSFVKKMHAKSKQVFVFTLNKEKAMARAVNLGVDGIITDRPDLAVKFLR